MTKNNDSPGPVVFKDLLAQRQDAASDFIGAQAVSAKWMTLAGSQPVGFMKLRNGMCRWPIGDPQQFDAFRFCGANCQPTDSYCEPHKQMAYAPSKATRSLPPGSSPAAKAL